MSDAKNDLIEKINKMSLEELWDIRGTARTTNRLITSVGVFLIFFALVVSNMFAYIAVFGLVYVLAHLAVGADMTMSVIEERILKLDPDK